MKILYHHRTLGDGAEGIHIKEMVTAFRGLGHKVLVIGPVNNQTFRPSSKNSWLSCVKNIAKGSLYELLEIGYNFYNYCYLRKVVAKFKPDLIYDRYITFNYSCVAFGKLNSIPVILEVNAPLAFERSKEGDESLFFKRVAFFLEKKICSDAFHTITVSTPLKSYLKSIGVPGDKVTVVPNGVDPKKFYPIQPSRFLQEKLGFLKGDKIIGFVGILRPWHGIDMLINAFKHILTANKKVKLLIVGDGPIKRDIEMQVEGDGIRDRVIITGRIPHEKVRDYVALFDIAVSPKTTFYASPMKIPEYMAQRKAVVAPNTKNIQDLISDGVTGNLFDRNSMASLVAAIKELLDNDSMKKAVELNAQKSILENFTWEKNAYKVLRLLEMGK